MTPAPPETGIIPIRFEALEDTQFPRSTKGSFIGREKRVTASPINHRISALHGILLPLILIGAPGPGEPTLTEDGVPLPHEHSEFSPRPASNLLEAQVVLSRENISCGPIDGVYGAQTQTALKAFQRKHHLRVNGDLDAATRDKLLPTSKLCRGGLERLGPPANLGLLTELAEPQKLCAGALLSNKLL